MSAPDPPNPNLVLPLGTRVVTRVALEAAGDHASLPEGAVGVIEHAPADATHAYRVRFPDGGVRRLRRDQLLVYRERQRSESFGGEDVLADRDLSRHVIYRCVTGSRAYGLAREGSDVDRRGVYLPPAAMHWSLYGVPEQLESPATEEVYWELGKFLRLALKANPNVLECLWSPEVELATPLAQELLGMRDAFLSKLAYQTYNGYALGQFRKLEQDLRARGSVRWKHAMHLLRLLLSGIALLESGELQVEVGAHRDRLLAVRDGEVPWEEVDAWRLELHRRFDRAYEASTLPEHPDHGRVDAFLVRARREAADPRPDTWPETMEGSP